MKKQSRDKNSGPVLRDHVFDGIQEYDQRLPNWWLVILYLTIIFSFFYWLYHFQSGMSLSDGEQVSAAMRELESIRAANSLDDLSNETLWALAGNQEFINGGRTLFQQNCVVCHGANMEGGIGLPLKDTEWNYGSRPINIYAIIAKGSPDASKGMVAWEPQLGQRGVIQVLSYILSQNDRSAMLAQPEMEPAHPVP